jgi:hypothetical protein
VVVGRSADDVVPFGHGLARTTGKKRMQILFFPKTRQVCDEKNVKNALKLYPKMHKTSSNVRVRYRPGRSGCS